MSRDTDGVSQTSLPHSTSEKAWQVVINIPQAVRDEPSEDSSLFAQNPLGGRDCFYRMLRRRSEPAKRLSVCWITAHVRNSGDYEYASCCASRHRHLGDLRLRCRRR